MVIFFPQSIFAGNLWHSIIVFLAGKRNRGFVTEYAIFMAEQQPFVAENQHIVFSSGNPYGQFY